MDEKDVYELKAMIYLTVTMVILLYLNLVEIDYVFGFIGIFFALNGIFNIYKFWVSARK